MHSNSCNNCQLEQITEIVVPAKMKRKMIVAETMSMGSSMSAIAAMIATISNIITK